MCWPPTCWPQWNRSERAADALSAHPSRRRGPAHRRASAAVAGAGADWVGDRAAAGNAGAAQAVCPAPDDGGRQRGVHHPVAGAVRGVADDHRNPNPRRGQRDGRPDRLHRRAAGAGGARGAGRGPRPDIRRRHRGRLPAAHPDDESRTAACGSGPDRRASGGGGDQHRHGLGRLGDRDRRTGQLVHPGLPDRQERSDPGRHHRAVRAGGRRRRAHRAGRPAGHPVGARGARRRPPLGRRAGGGGAR